MTYLVAAMVALAALGLFNLVLTFGIVRRLRAQAATEGTEPTVGIGQRVGDFVVRAGDGAWLGRGADGSRVMAFFTPDCKACEQQLPRFADFAAGFAGEAVAVLVAEEAREALAYQEKLKDIARIVVEPEGGVVATAYGVSSFPAMAVTDAQGMVLANGNAVGDLGFFGEPVKQR